MERKFLALARVSSREQEREGFSLDVQEEALQRYAERHGGSITKMCRIAETASRREKRQAFKALLSYAREHAAELDGVLFYKVDRAARNLFDYVELERLELECGLPVIYVAQPTESTPAGRMQRRILANMASFYTEQQSLDVREGMSRRVQSGLFPGKAPYGYRNVRVEGRGLIEVHPEEAEKVRHVFQLYAYQSHTLDSLVEALDNQNVVFREGTAKFSRSTIHRILRDRSYIGEVCWRGQWYPGTHEAIVDRLTWDRVQVLLGDRVYQSHELTYAGNLITCGHCGRPITGEVKTKKTRSGDKDYIYYRCTRYSAKGHPRVRLTEANLDKQVLALFDRIRIQDDRVREWFKKVLRRRSRAAQKASEERFEDLKRQLTLVKQQKDRLLNLRLLDEIEDEAFATKSAELRDRCARLQLQLEACTRNQDEHADLAVKAFELSQVLREKYVSADPLTKRLLLDIVCLNFTLDDVSLVPAIRKPFDVLAEGHLVQSGRGGRI